MLDDSSMSTASYDATLQGWSAADTRPSDIIIGAQSLTYCAGEAARAQLVSSNQWTFIGDQRSCP